MDTIIDWIMGRPNQHIEDMLFPRENRPQRVPRDSNAPPGAYDVPIWEEPRESYPLVPHVPSIPMPLNPPGIPGEIPIFPPVVPVPYVPSYPPPPIPPKIFPDPVPPPYPVIPIPTPPGEVPEVPDVDKDMDEEKIPPGEVTPPPRRPPRRPPPIWKKQPMKVGVKPKKERGERLFMHNFARQLEEKEQWEEMSPMRRKMKQALGYMKDVGNVVKRRLAQQRHFRAWRRIAALRTAMKPSAPQMTPISNALKDEVDRMLQDPENYSPPHRGGDPDPGDPGGDPGPDPMPPPPAWFRRRFWDLNYLAIAYIYARWKHGYGYPSTRSKRNKVPPKFIPTVKNLNLKPRVYTQFWPTKKWFYASTDIKGTWSKMNRRQVHNFY
jgi:hypothetical protein